MNSVQAGGTEITFYAQQTRPRVDWLSPFIYIDDRQLDDPVVGPRMKSRGLAVDHCI